jgi:hypothetical protein
MPVVVLPGPLVHHLVQCRLPPISPVVNFEGMAVCGVALACSAEGGRRCCECCWLKGKEGGEYGED